MSDQTQDPAFSNENSRDEFLKANDVDEIVQDDHSGEPMSDDDNDNDEEEETVEIDMRNNSSSYFDSHNDSVYLIATHPTLPMVVSGGGDNTAYLWTTTHNPPKVVAKLEGYTESVVAGGFTANGKFLVTGDMSGRLIVWKSNSTGEKWTVMSNTQEVEEIVHIAFHPTLSMFAVSASDGSIWCYEISDDVVNVSVLQTHSLPTTATMFVPSEDLQPQLFSASEDGLLILWDVYGSRAVYTLGAMQLRGEHPWVSLAISPTGKTIAAGSMDGIVVLIKIADGMLLKTVDTTSVKLESPIVSASRGNKTITSGEHGGDNDDEEEEDGRSIEGLAWSDVGNLLATGNVDGTIIVWEPQSWRPRVHFKLEDAVTKIQFLPKSTILVASSMAGTLEQYNVVNAEKIWECLGHSEGILGFAVQNNGKRLISAGDDQVCLVFNKE